MVTVGKWKAGFFAAALAATGCMQTQSTGERQAPVDGDNTAAPSAALVRVDQPTDIRALAVLVNFTDYQVNRTEAQFSALLNQPTGYNADGSNGSVHEYYWKQSNGLVDLDFEVVSVNLPRQHSYYINDFNRNPPWDGGQALVREVLAAVKAKYPAGFTGLSLHPTENRIWSVNFLAAWPGGGASNYGTNPWENVGVLNGGATVPVGAVSWTNFPVFEAPSINSITHELGHNLFEWSDYYYYRTDSTTTNIGHYCLMGSGGNQYGPMPINAGLRLQQGWIGNVVEVSKTARTTYTVTANSTNTVHKYTNPRDPREYYLIEAFRHGDYYVAVDGDGIPTDQGLAIWYIHEAYSSNSPYLRVKLVQADGRDDMSPIPETNNGPWLRGDMTDLFDDVYDTFDGTGYPMFGWKDGSPVDLRIEDISAPGATMSFTVVPPADNAISLPGRIEAEAFRAGGQNQGYFDLTSGNSGGAFRPSEDVDIEAAADAGGGYNVGWTQAGEWLRYDVDVSSSGTYTLTARVASAAAGTKTVNVQVDGVQAAAFSFTDASGWQSWRNVVVSNVFLAAGRHVLTIGMATEGINLNYLQVKAEAANQAPVSNAGPDQTVNVNSPVILDGRGSSDPDNGPQSLAFSWTQVSGPSVTLSNAGTNMAGFTPPTSGTYLFRLGVSDGSGTDDDTVQVTVQGGGVRIPLPGRLQAEDYRTGGEGVGYHDLTAGNSGGQFRSDNVDIEIANDVGGGHNVGWIDAGEWLQYDVNVTQTGTYNIRARLASLMAGTKTATVSVDGANVATFSFTDASGWQSWRDVTVSGVNLIAGNRTVRITMSTGGFNLNYLDVTAASAPDLILNGSFGNGLTGWQTQVSGGAGATFTNEAGSARIGITGVGSNPWDVQIYQQVALTAGKTYTLTFDMKAEATPKNFKVVVEHNADPWTKYHEQQYTVTTAANTYQRYVITWTQPVSDAIVRVGFHFGLTNVNDGWLDNVSLR